MKNPSYCIVECREGFTPKVTVFPYTAKGLESAQKEFTIIAKQNDINEDVEYNLDPTNTEAIANLCNGDGTWDLALIRSQVKPTIIKKNSTLWKKAVKYARRTYVNSKPIGFTPDGSKVIFQSLIRGNTWERSEEELDALLRQPSYSHI